MKLYRYHCTWTPKKHRRRQTAEGGCSIINLLLGGWGWFLWGFFVAFFFVWFFVGFFVVVVFVCGFCFFLLYKVKPNVLENFKLYKNKIMLPSCSSLEWDWVLENLKNLYKVEFQVSTELCWPICLFQYMTFKWPFALFFLQKLQTIFWQLNLLKVGRMQIWALRHLFAEVFPCCFWFGFCWGLVGGFCKHHIL